MSSRRDEGDSYSAGCQYTFQKTVREMELVFRRHVLGHVHYLAILRSLDLPVHVRSFQDSQQHELVKLGDDVPLHAMRTSHSPSQSFYENPVFSGSKMSLAVHRVE